MKPKLTAPQLRVLRLMSEGAVLRKGGSVPGGWLYSGRGIYRDLSQSMVDWLESNRMIEMETAVPDYDNAYKLTALGREAAGEGK